jgi:PiT family inorganic phosphate transporter
VSPGYHPRQPIGDGRERKGERAVTVLVLAIVMALAFALTNGFHDAANAIATLVATRVAKPLPAVLMAAVFNMLGPLLVGAAVANTIAKIVEVPNEQAVPVIGAGLTGAVVWNTYTWWRGLPSSSSHARVPPENVRRASRRSRKP